jgi:hypothetical protein
MAYSDTRGRDGVQLSSVDDAKVIIERFRRKDPSLGGPTPVAPGGKTAAGVIPPPAPSPWTSLTRLTVAAQLLDIVQNPRRIHQGPFNLCGPAAFWVIVASRNPKAFALAATDLFDIGKGTVGALVIAPSQSLMSTDFPAIVTRLAGQTPPHGVSTTETEWMLMSALQNSTPSKGPAWDGQPESGWSGMTLPGALVTWLSNTGFFASVVDNTSVVSPQLVGAATGLALGGGQDHAFLINAKLAGLLPDGLLEQAADFFTGLFPDHWILLTDPVVFDAAAQTVTLSYWSWGDTQTAKVLSLSLFDDNFFGAVSTRTQGPAGDFNVPSGKTATG